MTELYNPGSEIVSVVDGVNQEIGGVSRSEMREAGLLHRVTYLLVFNCKNQLLVQRRTKTKDIFPGMLDLAAGGVVLQGESYAESAKRELKEELGIDAELTFEFEIYFEDTKANPPNRNWGQVFSCVSEGPFTLQEEEVESAEFMEISKALEIDSDSVTPDTRQVLVTYSL